MNTAKPLPGSDNDSALVACAKNAFTSQLRATSPFLVISSPEPDLKADDWSPRDFFNQLKGQDGSALGLGDMMAPGLSAPLSLIDTTWHSVWIVRK